MSAIGQPVDGIRFHAPQGAVWRHDTSFIPERLTVGGFTVGPLAAGANVPATCTTVSTGGPPSLECSFPEQPASRPLQLQFLLQLFDARTGQQISPSGPIVGELLSKRNPVAGFSAPVRG